MGEILETMSRDILLHLIDADPEQPRKHFDKQKLDELAQSLSANGLAQPILLRPNGERFLIVHGERRYRAAKQLGWQSIPAEVRDLSPEAARWLALVENVQRSDLSPIEEAKSYQWHLDQGLTQSALGAQIGKSQSYIAQKLRLLKMPRALQFYLDRGFLSEGHARQLLRFKNIYMGHGTRSLKGMQPIPAGLQNEKTSLLDWLVLVFNALRPMDRVEMFVPETQEEFSLHLLAFTEFFEDGIGRDYVYPAWEIAAYWYAALAVHMKLSVADLKDAIDTWQNIMYSNVVHAGILPDPSKYAHSAENELWYMVRSDLRHAGLPSEIPTDLYAAAAQHCGDSLLYPSNMQSGGKHEDKALILKRRAEMAL